MTMGQATYRDVDAFLLQSIIAEVTEQDGIMSFMLGAHGKYFKLGVNYGGVWTNPTADSTESLIVKIEREVERAKARRSI